MDLLQLYQFEGHRPLALSHYLAGRRPAHPPADPEDDMTLLQLLERHMPSQAVHDQRQVEQAAASTPPAARLVGIELNPGPPRPGSRGQPSAAAAASSAAGSSSSPVDHSKPSTPQPCSSAWQHLRQFQSICQFVITEEEHLSLMMYHVWTSSGKQASA